MSTMREITNVRNEDGEDLPLLVEFLPQDRLLVVAAILGAGDLADGEEEATPDEWAARIMSKARALVRATEPKKPEVKP